MDAEEVQNHTGDQQKLIDVCVTPSVKIGKLQLLHSFRSFTCRGWTEADAAVPISINFAILENVGNLVCPAEFDTGSVKNAMILSVPEGDDKPLKYPLMFSICDVLLINKIDVLPYFDFDIEACKKYVRKLNPNMKIIPISARNGEGIDEWAQWLREQIHAWND